MIKKIFIFFFLFINFSFSSENFLQNVFITYENDSIYQDDKYYTNGAQLFLVSKNYKISNDNFYNYSFGFFQKMYTPKDIEIKEFLENDRPYSGHLSFYLNKNYYHNNQIDSIGLSLGCSGKCSLAEWTQKKIHSMIGSPEPKGWKYQLKNELLVMLSYLKIYNINKTPKNTYDWQLSPKFHIDIGTPYTKITPMLEFKYGYNLQNDYYRNKIDSNNLGVIKTNDFSFYAFFEIFGNWNLYNFFLDESMFSKNYYHIKKKKINYELNTGLTLLYKNYYIKWSNIFISKEIKEQTENQIIFSMNLGYIF